MKCKAITQIIIYLLSGSLLHVPLLLAEYFLCYYASPYLIKDRMRIKVNTTSTCAFIYIYFATKTVHIKLAIDFSIDALLNYLKKFITHQGLCHDLFGQWN